MKINTGRSPVDLIDAAVSYIMKISQDLPTLHFSLLEWIEVSDNNWIEVFDNNLAI